MTVGQRVAQICIHFAQTVRYGSNKRPPATNSVAVTSNVAWRSSSGCCYFSKLLRTWRNYTDFNFN